MFIDRKIVHVSDSLSAQQLYTSLRLRRDNLVNCFYDGLRDGLRNGLRPVLLVRGLGLTPLYVPDGFEPKPVTPEEIRALGKTSRLTCLPWNIVNLILIFQVVCYWMIIYSFVCMMLTDKWWIR